MRMELSSENEDDMEVLIEEVDNAPVWGPGTGRCIVNVHVRQVDE